MRLKTLVLTNFMGVRSLTIEANGGPVTIYGDNATGKTTVASAISWLLFGKDAHGNAKFEVKTLGENGEAIHNLEHRVAGTFALGDGRTIALTKTYKEEWTKKRGSQAAEFTGHKTLHHIDGVPVAEKEYKAKVAEVAPEHLFRLLTSPTYFPAIMPWQERRKLLMEVCGDVTVTDQDVIASDPELAPLAELTRSVGDEIKVTKESLKEINEELKTMPVRIDEARRLIPEEPGDKVAEEKLIASLNESLAKCRAEYAKAEAGENVEQKREFAKLEDAVTEIEREFRRKQAEAEGEADRQLYEAQKAVREMNQALEAEEASLAKMQTTDRGGEIDQALADLSASMDGLRDQYNQVAGQEYTPGICPACHQDLPEDADAEAKFNENKARRLGEINTTGKRHKAESERLAKEKAELVKQHLAAIADKRKVISQLSRQAADMAAAVGKHKNDLEAIQAQKVADLPSWQTAVAARDQAKASLESQDNTMELARLSAKATKIENEIATAQERVNSIKTGENATARVAELEVEEKDMSRRWEELSRWLYLLEQFTRQKAGLLEDQINGRFELARFRLFEDQINGGLKECCEVTYNGVPYGTNLNNGARINVGLDIIKTLSAHYGVQLPVVIDNAEAVTDLLEIDAQVIRLVVSKPDKKLRTEAE